MEHPLPCFLGLGTQKGGTTTLQALLQNHPQVFLPAGKELHYFTLCYGRGEGWYRDQFQCARLEQRCGEITPYYLFHPLAPERIKALLPEVKLLVLLRDPVERALSGYFHSVRLGLESLALEQALAAEPLRLAEAERQLQSPDGCHHSHQVHSYLSRSRYEQQLARYEHCFGAHQLLVLRSEDLFEQPEQVWGRVLQFLDLAPLPLPAGAAGLRRNSGAGEAAAAPTAVRQWLRRQLDPTYRSLWSRYGLRWQAT